MLGNAKRTVLVIEDNELNREILCEILSPTYHVIPAENGKIGLELLIKNRPNISLILLDILMPVMNGYEFLDAVRGNSRFANIPIIVTTSSASATDEIKCLENGASDFVAKPYNTDAVLRRVESMIRLSEASAVIDKTEYDDLTGVYNKEFFFLYAEQLLKSSAGTEFDVICSNIKSFKMINDRCGTKGGDELLSYIAEAMKSVYPENALYGKIGADVFAVLLPHQDESFYRQATLQLRMAMKRSPVPNVMVHFGLYRNVDHQLPASTICDNALLAIDEIKEQYGKYLAEYNLTIKQRLIREQAILDNVETALKEHQFQVYYQPKYNLSERKPGGAEALVRWTHPELGFISPGDFIPLFEKNGFIFQLDYYVMEQVCQDMQGWIRNHMPIVPISLNISRADFDDKDLLRNIEYLANQYEIPYDLIHLEVTETAYTDDPRQISETIVKLREMGFRVELDDFGAGYSSLNILTEMDLDVLKLDMTLVRNMHSEKNKLILRHILPIANELGMEIVAEGVETEEQANELREMGCTYAQGYLYSKPIPKEAFENYLRK